MGVKCSFISSIQELIHFCTEMTETDSSPSPPTDTSTTSAKKRKLDN